MARPHIDIPAACVAECCRHQHIRRLAFFEMELELSVLLGRKVDLNTPGFLSRYFRDQVLAEAVVQYDAAKIQEEALRIQ